MRFPPTPLGDSVPTLGCILGIPPSEPPPLRYGSESGSAGFKWLRRGVEGGGAIPLLSRIPLLSVPLELSTQSDTGRSRLKGKHTHTTTFTFVKGYNMGGGYTFAQKPKGASGAK